MIKIQSLNNAVMLARLQNYSQAAKALNMSQSALSRDIQRLEEVVGQCLFDRSSKAVIPTRAGEIMLKHAHVIIASAEAMQGEILQYQGQIGGTLCIGCGPYPATALLAPAIGRFCDLHPAVSIDLIVSDWTELPARLMKGEFDYVLMETSQLEVSHNVELIHLDNHPGFLFCRKGHPLLEKGKLTISELSQFPLVSTTVPKRLTEPLNRIFHPNEVAGASVRQPQSVLSHDLATMKSTVSNSNSIGLGTYGTLASDLALGVFVILPFRIPELRTGYDIVKRKASSLSPAACELITLLIEIDKEESILEMDLVDSLGAELTLPTNASSH